MVRRLASLQELLQRCPQVEIVCLRCERLPFGRPSYFADIDVSDRDGGATYE